MALSLNELLNNTAEVPVEYAGETFMVSYRPDSITTDKIEVFDATDVDAIFGLIVEVVDSWELELNGEQLPVDLESVKLIPVRLLRAIFGALTKDIMAGEADEPSSDI